MGASDFHKSPSQIAKNIYDHANKSINVAVKNPDGVPVNSQLLENTNDTTRIQATGTYDPDTDKMSQDVSIENSPDLRSVIACLGLIDERLRKMNIMLAEMTSMGVDDI